MKSWPILFFPGVIHREAMNPVRGNPLLLLSALFTFMVLSPAMLMAQDEGVKTRKHPILLKDSLDGKFDMSDYLIDASGFVPVPDIITEPALGGFGIALAPVFIKKRPPYIDSLNGKRVITPIAPDLTGGGAAYTVNNTWLLGAFRSGTILKSRIKYTVAAGYANVNMAFYKSFPVLGEKKLEFNFHTVPLHLQATKRLGLSHWYAGMRYVFLRSNVKYNGGRLLDSLGKRLETDQTISELGAIVELDNRDNIFTPDHGLKLHADAMRSDNIFGSDKDFWRLDYYMYDYLPLARSWTAGIRVDGAQTYGDVPFYLQPFVDMRGVPSERYQGNTALVTELELRWDFVLRWSAVAFSGVGKAFDQWNDFGSATWAASYGAGFRYLIARKFKLRMGVDLAHGADGFAYYIIFGSNWLR